MKNIKNLEFLRNEIDKIDFNIIDLLNKRKLLSIKISEYKKSKKIPVKQVKRESEALEKRIRYAKNHQIKRSFVKKLFNLIFSESREEQKKAKILVKL
jgi:chorismate mutase